MILDKSKWMLVLITSHFDDAFTELVKSLMAGYLKLLVCSVNRQAAVVSLFPYSGALSYLATKIAAVGGRTPCALEEVMGSNSRSDRGAIVSLPEFSETSLPVA